MAFSIDSIFDKVSEAFDKAAEKDYEDADRAEQLAELFDDPALRGQINGVIASGALVGLTFFNRIKDIIVKDEEGETPTEEPKTETPEQPFASGGTLPGNGTFTISEDAQKQAKVIIEALRKARESQGGQSPFGGYSF